MGKILGIVAFCFVVGCGNSETVTLKVLPSFGPTNSTINLQEEISNELESFTRYLGQNRLFIGSCRQKEVRVLTQAMTASGPSLPPNSALASVDTQLTALPTGTPSPVADLSWLVTNVAFNSPINVTVPRGQSTLITVLGVLYDPLLAADGSCSESNAGTAPKAITFIGNALFDGSSSSVPINLYGMRARPATTPIPPTWSGNTISNVGAYSACTNPNSLPSIDGCPVLGFLEALNLGDASGFKIGSITYGGGNGAPPITLFTNDGQGTMTSNFIGGYYPVTVNYQCTTPSSASATVTYTGDTAFASANCPSSSFTERLRNVNKP